MSADAASGWVRALEPGAPDVVAIWRAIDIGELLLLRRELRRRSGPGTAQGTALQLATLADALRAVVGSLTDVELARPGGKADWNVAQAVGHTAESRAGLALAAMKAATGHWPDDAPAVVPGIPGDAGADQAELLRRIAMSQRVVERAARSVAGHESDPCPLIHPQVGRLRCGEWLTFAGVHDLMHLEQLHVMLDATRT